MHRVGEDIGQGVGSGPQGLNRRIAVVDGVGKGPVGGDIDRTVGTGHVGTDIAAGTADCTGGDPVDGFGITHIRIGIVGQDITGWVGTGATVADSARFDGHRRVGHCGGGVIGVVDLDQHDLVECRTGSVRHASGDRMTGGRFIVEQRSVGDRNHTGGAVDRKPAAGVIDEAERARVAGVDVLSGQRPHSGTIGGVLIDAEAARDVVGRVVGTLNRDRDLRGAGQASSITHGVGEGIGQSIGRAPQSLNRRVAVVNVVGKGTVGGDIDRAIGTGHIGTDIAAGTADCAGEDPGDSPGIAGIRIGIVGQDVAGGIGTGATVADSARFDGNCRVGDCGDCFVDVQNGNGDLFVKGQPGGVGRTHHHAARSLAFIIEIGTGFHPNLVADDFKIGRVATDQGIGNGVIAVGIIGGQVSDHGPGRRVLRNGRRTGKQANVVQDEIDAVGGRGNVTEANRGGGAVGHKRKAVLALLAGIGTGGHHGLVDQCRGPNRFQTQRLDAATDQTVVEHDRVGLADDGRHVLAGNAGIGRVAAAEL